MPFGLKNASTTYERLVNMMLKMQISKMMEVYIDDILVKSKVTSDHISYLADTFHILKAYQMKLNPLKFTFGVASEKFHKFMVIQQGIEANLEKIQVLINIRPLEQNKGGVKFDWEGSSYQ